MKLAIFLANGFEEVEALTVVDLCRRAEIEVDMISIQEDRIVQGARGIEVTANELFSQIKDFDYDMYVLPGGMPGTKNLEAHEGLKQLLYRVDQEKAYIAAICAAPSILGKMGLLKGKKACCYPGFEEYLEEALISTKAVEVAEHIITSKGVGTAIEFSLKIVECLKSESTSKILAKQIIFE